MAINVIEMFANSVNDEVIATLTDSEINELIEILNKAGY